MGTLLIVGDRPAGRGQLATLLAGAGHRPLQAADGAEALVVARAEHPQLVIADVLLPTMDGEELVRRLRADPALAATPVLFWAARYHERQARSLADACGVPHVLTRPAEPEGVLRAVDAALGLTPPPPADTPSAEGSELRRENERLAELIDLVLDLSSEHEPRRLLQGFCHAAREVLGARYAVVGVVDEGGRKLRDWATSGMDPAAAAPLSSSDPSQGVLGAVLGERRCARGRNPCGSPGGAGLPPSFPSFQSFLAAPVTSPARAFGWLCLLDRLGAEEFSPEDERLAAALAAQAGRLYESASLYADALAHAGALAREAGERRQAQSALAEREERTRLLLDSTAGAIYGMDPHGRCTFANAACARLLRYAGPHELLGRDMHALIHHTRPDGTPYPEEECRISRAFRRGEETHAEDEVLWRADGSSFPAEYWSYPVRRGGQVVGCVVTFLDITERRRLEEQLRQAQKMEAVGRLAGGVAHDFNNLLTVINGYGEMVLDSLPAGDPTRELVREMVAAGDRAAALTRQLLAFSRKTILAPRVLDVRVVVADMERMLRRIIGEDVHLVSVADPEVGAVRADPGQVEQVILNLAVNARDAMPRGGRLTIEVRNAELDETYARGHPDARPGPHVLLAVSDSGCGMDPATRAHIFEPFFTTKGERGTGLGLATVYGVVKQSGGHVAVYSEPGHGTTFKVYLPRVEERPRPGRSYQGVAAVPGGSETVLLVEDEDGVRGLARHALQTCGYTVLEARDGAEALRVAGQHPGRVDLLVTDVVLPRTGGRELAERLAALQPGVRVLFLSGYTEDAVVRHGILEAQVAFLQKPFTPASLAAKVREVLDAG